MFGFIKKMFIRLLSACTTSRLGESVVCNSEGSIKYVVQHEPCECKCGLNESICNSNQIWNHDECWCECKELDDLSSCKDNYM